MSTCGNPDCTADAGHGGDFHIGETDPVDGTTRIWPKASARVACAAKGITGPVWAYMSPPTEDQAARRVENLGATGPDYDGLAASTPWTAEEWRAGWSGLGHPALWSMLVTSLPAGISPADYAATLTAAYEQETNR